MSCDVMGARGTRSRRMNAARRVSVRARVREARGGQPGVSEGMACGARAGEDPASVRRSVPRGAWAWGVRPAAHRLWLTLTPSSQAAYVEAL